MGSSTPQSELFNLNPVLCKLHDVEVCVWGGGGGGGGGAGFM